MVNLSRGTLSRRTLQLDVEIELPDIYFFLPLNQNNIPQPIFFLNCNIFGLAGGGGLQMAKIWLKWCFFALMDNCANNYNN